MKNNIILLLLFLCQFATAQTNQRKTLHGQVVNTNIVIEGGYVMNINAKVKTAIGVKGLFDILARPKDTLLITGASFQSKKLVVTEKDMAQEVFTIPLDLVDVELKEVLIQKQLKVNALQGGSQRFVDMQFEDDQQSTAKNTVMYSDQTIKYGTDFVRIFKDIKKLLNNKQEIKEEEITDIAFVAYSKDNFTKEFFTSTLGLNEGEIDLFLMYCSNDVNSKRYLKSDQKFQLMDFMVNKNKDFKNVALNTK
jgi:hypothetical protein